MEEAITVVLNEPPGHVNSSVNKMKANTRVLHIYFSLFLATAFFLRGTLAGDGVQLAPKCNQSKGDPLYLNDLVKTPLHWNL